MNQTKTKRLASPAVAGGAKTPYTAARHAKDGAMTATGTEEFGAALDRRVTEGFNLIHGRLDVLQEDVRENRRDLKGLRKELWDGLSEAAAERGRLTDKSELAAMRVEMNDRFNALEASQHDLRAEMNERFRALEASQHDLRAEMNERFRALEASQRDLRTEMNGRFATLEAGHREIIAKLSTTLEQSSSAAWARRNIWVAVAAGTSLLVIGALLRPVLERVAAALIGG